MRRSHRATSRVDARGEGLRARASLSGGPSRASRLPGFLTSRLQLLDVFEELVDLILLLLGLEVLFRRAQVVRELPRALGGQLARYEGLRDRGMPLRERIESRWLRQP